MRDVLVSVAESDPRITGAALVGSGAVGREDRWSDIDLALRLDGDPDETGVVDDWTSRMYRDHGAVHHLDVRRGDTLFRVFLLSSTLQVDLSFWPSAEFGATGSTFRLLFGEANELPPVEPPAVVGLIGTGWLYALHARSSIARGRLWQAEYMVSGMRDQVLALACLRHDVPAVQGRGMDDLPSPVTDPFVSTLVRSVEADELGRAFAATVEMLLVEIEKVDAELASTIAATLRELANRSTIS